MSKKIEIRGDIEYYQIFNKEGIQIFCWKTQDSTAQHCEGRYFPKENLLFLTLFLKNSEKQWLTECFRNLKIEIKWQSEPEIIFHE